jgi:exonuclease SbcD
MKIFHTSDWHLGKTLQQQSLLEDQEHILREFTEAANNERPDAIVIAGDIYDRQITSPEAVKLLDQVLRTLIVDLEIPVLAIAGNHDSPSRLGFGKQLMSGAGFYIAGEVTDVFSPVILEDASGPVHFHLLPFADLGTIRHALVDQEICSFNSAYEKIIDRIKQSNDESSRRVLVAHAFVTPDGGPRENTSDSERPLTVGGSEFVSAAQFSVFNYTALGHLHRSMKVKEDRIHYSGSLLKYSISEENHCKGFLVVEIDGDGIISVEHRQLNPLRDLRTVEGFLSDIERQEQSDDYIFVRLLDTFPVTDPMTRVRSVYPNALRVQNESLFRQLTQQDLTVTNDRTEPFQMFCDFYKKIRNRDLPENARVFLEHLLSEMDREEVNA